MAEICGANGGAIDQTCLFDLFLGGGFKYFLFSSLFGKMIQFD